MDATVAMLGSNYGLGCDYGYGNSAMLGDTFLDYGGFSLDDSSVGTPSEVEKKAQAKAKAEVAAKDIAGTSDPVVRRSKILSGLKESGTFLVDAVSKIAPLFLKEVKGVAGSPDGDDAMKESGFGPALTTGLIVGGVALTVIAIMLISKKRRLRRR